MLSSSSVGEGTAVSIRCKNVVNEDDGPESSMNDGAASSAWRRFIASVRLVRCGCSVVIISTK